MHNGSELFLAALACGVLNFTAARFSTHNMHPSHCCRATQHQPTLPGRLSLDLRLFLLGIVVCLLYKLWCVCCTSKIFCFTIFWTFAWEKPWSLTLQTHNTAWFIFPYLLSLSSTARPCLFIPKIPLVLIWWGEAEACTCLCMICLANTLFSKTHCLSTRHKYWVGNGGMVRS